MADQSNVDLPELITLSACSVVDHLKAGEISGDELLDALEARVEQVDGVVNALPIRCFDRARKDLGRRDPDELKATILAGMPVAIKDLTEVRGVRTTMGSLLYKDHVSEESDILVEGIESQGGVIYAKSNTPEFATGGNTDNKVFGPTRNPWNNQLSVSGSSGGAAASLATGTAWLAQGSDMGGSLRNPASFCGVVGLRPTIGRIPSSLGWQSFDTLSTNGPMARNIEDLALFFDAMVGRHHLDPLSMPPPSHSYRSGVKEATLPKKIAFSLDLGITPVDPVVAEVFFRGVKQIEQAGVIVEEAAPDFSGLQDVFGTLRAFSYAASFGEMLNDHESALNQDVVWNTKKGLALTVDDIIRAETMRTQLISRVAKFFEKYEILVTPATIVPPYPLTQSYVDQCDGYQFENYYEWLSIAYAFTTAACPALSMPCGMTKNGLPIGLQVVSANKNEWELLRAASGFESLFGLGDLTPVNPIVDSTPVTT